MAKKILKTTEAQERIINEESNCVVVAKPGSGKTHVLSEKIKRIIPNLPDYKGIIAISFTNKASKELENRSLSGGLYKKASFFGTIDSFFISEIIMPFGAQLFGRGTKERLINRVEDLEMDKRGDFSWLDSKEPFLDLVYSNINVLKEYFLNGFIILETVPLLAIYIFDNSIACKNYFKARYSHVFIDEYQDSGEGQHEVFLRLKQLGLTAIAVGDVDQSIYAFAGKDSKFLSSLPQEGFKLLPLQYNHRSHNSIVNYASTLLDSSFELLECDRKNVIEKNIIGNEVNIAEWINRAAVVYKKKFGVKNFKDICILTKSNKTAQIIDKNLKLEHKLFIQTELDNDINPSSILFKNLLKCSLDKEENKYDLVKDLVDIDNSSAKLRKIISIINNLRVLFEDVDNNEDDIVTEFKKVSKEVFQKPAAVRSIELLYGILSDKVSLDSYLPPKDNQINIMTLHKSKGLEFDLVFHLDLYDYVLPRKWRDGYEIIYPDYKQDLNLHYVGITRAKTCCVLVSSTQRHNAKQQEVRAEMSEFFNRNNLGALRIK